MFRYLLWAFLAFSLVRLVSRLLKPVRESSPPPPRETKAGILVQDPACGTFVDRSRALVGTDRNGERHYFCSEACRRKASS